MPTRTLAAGCATYLGSTFLRNEVAPEPDAPVAVHHRLSLRDIYLASSGVARIRLERRDVLRPNSWIVTDVDSGKQDEIDFRLIGRRLPAELAEQSTVIVAFLGLNGDLGRQTMFVPDTVWAAVGDDVIDLNPSTVAVAQNYAQAPIATLCNRDVFHPKNGSGSVIDRALLDAGIVSPAQRSFYATLRSHPFYIVWWSFYKNSGGKEPFPTAFCSAQRRTNCFSPEKLRRQLGLFVRV